MCPGPQTSGIACISHVSLTGQAHCGPPNSKHGTGNAGNAVVLAPWHRRVRVAAAPSHPAAAVVDLNRPLSTFCLYLYLYLYLYLGLCLEL